MSTKPALSAGKSPSDETAGAEDQTGAELPTAPCSVVWSGGHCYVREGASGARWAGVDDRGRARFLTDAELHRRGWSHRRR
ncbi:hypothetical protein [Saccharopolyspora griseoalba]|uniref:Uncharacterized protein n=1 Tax=Saccharopolyspora griseoalba TaxID=1431848 RepID=A0ABW2LEV7_9PSEU